MLFDGNCMGILTCMTGLIVLCMLGDCRTGVVSTGEGKQSNTS